MMTQYDERVQYQRDKLEAEAWAKIPKSVHIHRLESMWYETEESKVDFEKGNVVDIQYNNGVIKRQQDGKTIRTFGKEITGKDLVHLYHRGGE